MINTIREIYDRLFRGKIDFSNPCNGRKWLLLLEENDLLGITFKPNCSIDKDKLGFSFISNRFGFRGPSNNRGVGVICGTSYAMGLSVDNGTNWFDLKATFDDFLNVGMPVGIHNHVNAIQNHFIGERRVLVYIYHPNVWITNENFRRAQKANVGIFEQMKWKVNFISVIKLYLRWFLKTFVFSFQKTFDYQGTIYAYNNKYAEFNEVKYSDSIADFLQNLRSLFGLFENVLIVRVPIKEQLINEMTNDPKLDNLIDNYNYLWSLVKTSFKEHKVEELAISAFNLDDYHQYDTHWNESGNQKFATYLDSLLQNFL